MLDREGVALRDALLELFRRPLDDPPADEVFDRHARAVFAYQYERNRPYGEYCRRRGVTPRDLPHWTRIPAVPTAAFRELVLVAGRPEDAETVFRTSGTTRGGERRGTHAVLDLSLYHGSLLPCFRHHVLPDEAGLPFLSILPPSAELPDSSLAHMLHVVTDSLGAEGSDGFATVRDGIDYDRLERTLRRFTDEGRPVCLLGTSFSFVHWLDRLATRDTTLRLPAGSRLMDTGGYKGRSREVPAEQLRALYGERLGLDQAACINEYGMTELSSQFYDSTLADARGPRRKLGPHWVRTRIVDPDSLEPVEPGTRGLLQHVDLANLGSVLAVQTEDVGVEEADGFLVLGRAGGAMPRGCSIAVDEMLAAARRS